MDPAHVVVLLVLFSSSSTAKQPMSSWSQLGAEQSAVLTPPSRTLTTEVLEGEVR